MSNLVAVVDAFTSEPFCGNPAGVLLLESWPADEWMQRFAAEMKHSETAFLVPKAPNHYYLRWFTPTVEMKLCGHATLAAAHLLFERSLADRHHPIRFDTLSGELQVEWQDGHCFMDFPVWEPTEALLPDGVLDALGAGNAEVVKAASGEEYLIVVDSPETVRNLAPNFARLAEWDIHLYIVTAPGPTPYDFSSRVFAPSLGIDEDPVTGSAHTLLAPWWSQRLGKHAFRARQSSQRGGDLELELRGDRVRIGGAAVTIFVGELAIPAM